MAPDAKSNNRATGRQVIKVYESTEEMRGAYGWVRVAFLLYTICGVTSSTVFN